MVNWGSWLRHLELSYLKDSCTVSHGYKHPFDLCVLCTFMRQCVRTLLACKHLVCLKSWTVTEQAVPNTFWGH